MKTMNLVLLIITYSNDIEEKKLYGNRYQRDLNYRSGDPVAQTLSGSDIIRIRAFKKNPDPTIIRPDRKILFSD